MTCSSAEGRPEKAIPFNIMIGCAAKIEVTAFQLPLLLNGVIYVPKRDIGCSLVTQLLRGPGVGSVNTAVSVWR